MKFVWTEDQCDKLRQLYLSGERRNKIARAMNMTEGAIKTQLFVLPFTDEELAQRKVNRRLFNNIERRTTRAWKEQPHKIMQPCPNAMADRDRRLALQPRDLTAALCGDPPPGYSALERRA